VKRYLTVLASVLLPAGLAACAAPPDQDADGGPTFIQSATGQTGLVGATPQMLATAFGQPAILRVDGSAQVWLYHTGACGLNLILYPDSGGTPRVAAAAPTDDGTDLATCSTALVRAHIAASGFGAAPVTASVTPAASAVSRPAIAPAGAIEPAPAGSNAAGNDGLERPSSS
jgi:hypothetical protein